VVRLVDSHCHINFDPLGEETGAVLQRARENGVQHMLCVSVNLEDYPQVLELARQHENVFASAGVHPNEKEGRDPTTEELVDLARDPAVVAIGETGLDYFRSEEAMDWQHERFRKHIRAAIAAGKPLIIHTRDAARDTMDILREESARDAGGVMHCFVEDWEVATQALDIGFYISFSGIVTFKNAGDLREVARKVPRDRILVETDSPYLAPVPYRGKTNEPSYVRFVAEALAELRKEDLEEFCEQTTDNFFRLFSSAVPVS
jgi:TatD DNase family protein